MDDIMMGDEAISGKGFLRSLKWGTEVRAKVGVRAREAVETGESASDD
jgi:hypothetical protein